MHRRLNGLFGWLPLALLLAAAGQPFTSASADSLLAEIRPASLDVALISPLIADDLAPVDSGKVLAFRFSGPLTVELLAAGARASGLEFSLNPADEELVLGWRFKF